MSSRPATNSSPRKSEAPLVIFSLIAGLAACSETSVPAELRVVGGDVERGRAVIARIGCNVCHVVPGVPGPRGTVGPSLENFGARNLIGGIVPNQPSMLTRWVRDAPSIAPQTGMPNLPVSEEEARDVAAYLYTLR